MRIYFPNLDNINLNWYGKILMPFIRYIYIYIYIINYGMDTFEALTSRKSLFPLIFLVKQITLDINFNNDPSEFLLKII